jgi:hypothetical protein
VNEFSKRSQALPFALTKAGKSEDWKMVEKKTIAALRKIATKWAMLNIEGLDWNDILGAGQTITVGFCSAR